MTDFILSDDMRFEQIKSMTLEEIRLCCDDMLAHEYVWKMLFKRDYPLHDHINGEYMFHYKKIETLQILSQMLPNHYIQEESLEFIKNYSPVKDISKIMSLLAKLMKDDRPDINVIVYDDIRYLVSEKYVGELYHFLTEIIYQYILDNIWTTKSIDVPRRYYKNGIISVHPYDSFMIMGMFHVLFMLDAEMKDRVVGGDKYLLMDVIMNNDSKALNKLLHEQWTETELNVNEFRSGKTKGKEWKDIIEEDKVIAYFNLLKK